jgi:hypothetical protein
MLLRPRMKDVDPGERALWGDLLSLGMVFPIAILLGLLLGRWLGGLLGHRIAGQWLGLAWGVAAAFLELFKTARRLDRMDKAGAGQGPGQDGGPEDDHGQ